MRRRLLVGLGVIAAAAALGVAAALATGVMAPPWGWAMGVGSPPPIVVGLLHSQTGPQAIGEKALLDAEILALEEINARGGVAGRPVVWVVKDGRSDASTFATEARRLIDDDKASVLFGCWTADGRKAVQSVVEERGNMLVFPANYEGMERSPRTIYTGGVANQSVVPAMRWCFESLKARRFFVVGTEEIWSRSVSEIAEDAARATGAEVVGRHFLPMTGGDVEAAVAAVRAAKPDVVVNMLVGDSNVPFLAASRRAGLTPEGLPMVFFGIAEDEIRRIPPGDVAGHYAGMAYFQSLDRAENRDFVRRFRARYGEDRTTSDPIVAAYNGVRLWAQAANEAGTADATVVLVHFDRQSLDAPEGIVTIDPDTRVVWRPFLIGRARPDGQFDIAWSLPKPIRPSAYVGTRSRGQWRAFLADLRGRRAGPPPAPGPDAAPAPKAEGPPPGAGESPIPPPRRPGPRTTETGEPA